MGKSFTKYRQIRRKFDAETGTVATVERVTIDRGNVSPEAKANRARAGAANLQRWREEQKLHPPDKTIETQTAQFRASLAADTGGEPSAGQLILIESACASYAALSLCVQRLRRLRNNFEKTLELTSRLASLQRSLLKTVTALREMGAMDADDSINDELEAIEREIAAKRTEVKPS